METTKTATETLQDAVNALGVTYTAEFVPFSKSRNAKKATKPGDYSLNWKVTISKGGRKLTTDYMQGIGHIPGHKHNTRYTMHAWEALKHACETGKSGYDASRIAAHVFTKAIPAPALHDVLHCLVLDAGVLDAGSFEEWASEYGYETDSRSAEKI